MTATQDRLLSTTEVGELLGVKPLTVREWARTGRIDAVTVNRLWRVRNSIVQKIAKEGLGERQPARGAAAKR
jgi:excisionase family DNA binding protein